MKIPGSVSTVLVTGATGLVGSRLCLDLLLDGRRVRALRRASSSLGVIRRTFSEHPELLDKIEWVEGDITDVNSIYDALDGVNMVFHSAALVSFQPSDHDRMMRINAEGTANVVNMSLERSIEKLCYISSIAAIGRSAEEGMITEKTSWKNSKYNSRYSISKLAAEREVWRGFEEGLKGYIVNPSVIIGAGTWKDGSSQLFTAVWKGLKFYPPGSTGFVDVRDVSKACLLLDKNGVNGERYILNAENISWKRLFTLIASSIERKAPRMAVTPLMFGFAWRLEWFKSFFFGSRPALTRETARSSSSTWSYSSEKIRKETGMEFMPVEDSVHYFGRLFLKDKNSNGG